MDIPKGDTLDEGEWLLCFKIDDKDLCLKTGLHWMYIDEKIKNGFTKDINSDCYNQLYYRKHSSPPFSLDRKFKENFQEVINQNKYKAIRKAEYVKNITPNISKFLNEIKGYAKRL